MHAPLVSLLVETLYWTMLKGLCHCCPQVEQCKLLDFKGGYDYYLDQNTEEAAKMEVKEDKAREIEKANIKSTSKMTRCV